jgi:phage head maturation protease
MRRKYSTIFSEDMFFITTPDVDLEGDRVDPLGLDLEGYRQNPVVLHLHDAYASTAACGIPVATATALSVSPAGVACHGLDWLVGDAFADRVRNAFDQGVIRGLSIGFIPLESRPNKFGGHDITKSRLLEFSLVPIPANPAAVRGGR